MTALCNGNFSPKQLCKFKLRTRNQSSRELLPQAAFRFHSTVRNWGTTEGSHFLEWLDARYCSLEALLPGRFAGCC